MALLARLAWRNLRARPGQALLLLLALSLATTTVTLALAVNETGNDSWDRLHSRTNGFHVRTARSYRLDAPPPATLTGSPAPTAAEVARTHETLTDMAGAAGVVAHSGPWPMLATTGTVGGSRLELFLLVRPTAPEPVGQPLVTSGGWLAGIDDEVVLEDGLASVLHVTPGSTVTLAGQPVRVRGTAMTVSVGRYPLYQPPRVWVSPPAAARLRAAGAVDIGATLELRLADPDAAPGFAAAHGPGLETWQETRAGSHSELTVFAATLLVIGTLLAFLTIATAAVLVAGRMAARSRQVGALKAVGLTPGQATGVLLMEYLAVAMVASIVGIVAGTLFSPRVVRSAASMYGAPQAPPITWSRSAVAIGVAATVVVLATVGPALRGVRQSTVRALAANVRPPRRASRLGRLAGRLGLPLPAVLGLRGVTRRPGRTAANVTGLALGIAMVIVGLALYRGARRFLASPLFAEAGDRAVNRLLFDQLLTIVFAAAALLVALAVINAFVVAVFAARDSARHHAILRTLGATPRQTVTSFVVTQLAACLIACATGIPLGVLLFATAAGDDLNPVDLPLWTYAVVAVGALATYLVTVIGPARILARSPVTTQLTYE